jgi:hypothetical protein
MRTIAALCLTFVLVPAVHAFNPQPEPPGFGMVGVINSQTARLTASLAAPPEPDHGGFPPGPCRGELRLQFLDQAGRVVVERTVRIATGESMALRSHIRATVSWIAPPEPERGFPPGPCRASGLFGTVEVYNTDSGATQFVLPGTFGAFKE